MITAAILNSIDYLRFQLTSKWVRRGLAVACALVLAGGVGVLVVRSQDSATPLRVTDAVERFRGAATASSTTLPSTAATNTTVAVARSVGSQPTASRAPSPGSKAAPGKSAPLPSPAPKGALPAPGVYVYATAGGEHVDVLGGASHQYPPETTITVSAFDCGVNSRWDALKERWDEQRTCLTAAGEVLRSVTQYHEFFGRGDRRDYTCEGPARPAADAPGRAWTMHCTNPTSTVTINNTVVGIETVVVGGRAVETVHMRSASTVAGSVRGTSTYEVWAARSNGLVVRRIGTVDTDADSPLGKAHYTERYEIRLESLDPRN